jgi:hypothetical protein
MLKLTIFIQIQQHVPANVWMLQKRKKMAIKYFNFLIFFILTMKPGYIYFVSQYQDEFFWQKVFHFFALKKQLETTSNHWLRHL